MTSLPRVSAKRAPSYGRSQHHVSQPEPVLASTDYFYGPPQPQSHHHVNHPPSGPGGEPESGPDEGLELESLAANEIAASEAEIRAIEEEYRRER